MYNLKAMTLSRLVYNPIEKDRENMNINIFLYLEVKHRRNLSMYACYMYVLYIWRERSGYVCTNSVTRFFQTSNIDTRLYQHHDILVKL